MIAKAVRVLGWRRVLEVATEKGLVLAIVATIPWAAGLWLMWLAAGWRAALGALLLFWANNLSMGAGRLTAESKGRKAAR